MELPVPLSPLIFASYSCFLFLFPVVFFSFEVVFENCKCRSWCRPDDLVSSSKINFFVSFFKGAVKSNEQSLCNESNKERSGGL